MNIVRKPLSSRIPVFARSATWTLCGTGGRLRLARPTPERPEPSSPAELSTRAGSRIASTVAPTNTRKA